MDNQQQTTTLLPPYNEAIETSFLGSLLINCSSGDFELLKMAINRISITANSFFIIKNGIVFSAILALYNQTIKVGHTGIDIITVSAALDLLPDSKRFGVDSAYLTYLQNSCDYSLNTQSYAVILRKLELHRNALEVASKLAAKAYDNTESVEDMLTGAIDELSIQRSGWTQMYRDTAAAADDVYDAMLADLHERVDKHERGELTGIPTGIRWWDEEYGGLQRKELTFVVAPSNVGKSALMIYVMNTIMEKVKSAKIALFSAEMGNSMIGYRIAAMRHGISLDKMLRGTISRAQIQQLQQAELSGFSQWHDRLKVYDPSEDRTIENIADKARRMARDQGLDALFLDYFQAFSSKKRFNNRHEELAYISRSIKDLCEELGIATFVAVQPNKEALSQRRSLRLEDIAGSADARNAIDMGVVISHIHFNQDATNENEQTNARSQYEREAAGKCPYDYKFLRMEVAKSRNFHTATYHYYFEPAKMRFHPQMVKEHNFSDIEFGV